MGKTKPLDKTKTAKINVGCQLKFGCENCLTTLVWTAEVSCSLVPYLPAGIWKTGKLGRAWVVHGLLAGPDFWIKIMDGWMDMDGYGWMDGWMDVKAGSSLL